MSLADRLAEPQSKKGGRPCSLCTAMKTMTEKERQLIEDCMADEDASDEWLAEQIIAEGYEIARTSIGTHRRGKHTG